MPFFFMTAMGLMPNRYFQYTDAVLAPPGEARDEGLILRQILQAAGFSLFGSKSLQWALNQGEKLYGLPGCRDGAAERFYGMIARKGKLGGLKKLRRQPQGQSSGSQSTRRLSRERRPHRGKATASGKQRPHREKSGHREQEKFSSPRRNLLPGHNNWMLSLNRRWQIEASNLSANASATPTTAGPTMSVVLSRARAIATTFISTPTMPNNVNWQRGHWPKSAPTASVFECLLSWIV